MKILFPIPRGAPPGRPLALAIEVALRHGGEILAFFVVDREGIGRAEAGAPPGAIHLAQQAEKRIAEHEEAEGRKAVDGIVSRCRAAGVPCRGEIVIGDPRREIEKATARCDLLVSPNDSRFAFGESDDPGELVLSLVKKGSIPVLLSASRPATVATAVVGCGGGDRTARAVGALARLSLWKSGVRLILLAVAGTEAEGQARLSEPRRILAEAGYGPAEEKVVGGPKLETFESFLSGVDADVAVLGGLGEHRWDDLVGRSVTGRLIAGDRRHLFLFM